MMSGLRSHRDTMMTWVSLRSGVASTGRCTIDHAPQRQPAATKAKTNNLFRAENSMMRLIIDLAPAIGGVISFADFYVRILARIVLEFLLTAVGAEVKKFAVIFLNVAAGLRLVRFKFHAANWITVSRSGGLSWLRSACPSGGESWRSRVQTTLGIDQEIPGNHNVVADG